MDEKTLVAVLENLIYRIELDRNTNKYKIDGPITPIELSTLKYLLEFLGGNAAPIDTPPPPVVRQPKPELNLASLEYSVPQDPAVLLCLDFGTAMSKAFASILKENGDVDFLELALGKQAGEENTVYPVTSSLWISDDGFVFLGRDAVKKSVHSDRPRFDSLKQAISQIHIHNPNDVPIPKELNPTDISISQEEAIIIYLSYLTDIATTELSERHSRSKYVRRRFALPSWSTEQKDWGTALLKKYLAYSQILADTFHGKWRDGLPIIHIKQAIDAVRQLERIPDYLVDEGVLEPIAAGESRLQYLGGIRNLAVIVDVGAGTTDFAVFHVVNEEDKPCRIGAIPGCSMTFRQAGDTIDDELRKYIINKANIPSTDNSYTRINTALKLQIRSYKEVLFKSGTLTYKLVNDDTGTITLDEFLNTESMKEFSKKVQEKFMEALHLVDKSWYSRFSVGGLDVVMTGGGASLPMITSLGEGASITVHGITLPRRAAPIVPESLQDYSHEFINEYPQLAVAIGGTAPVLPVEVKTPAEIYSTNKSVIRLGGFFTTGA